MGPQSRKQSSRTTSTKPISIASRRSFARSAAGYIYDDADAERLQQEIVLVDVRNPSRTDDCAAPRTRMSPSRQRAEVSNCESSIFGLVSRTKDRAHCALLPLIRPNVVLDQTATATARETEANQIEPVVISLKRNQVVAREGDTVTPNILAQITAIKQHWTPVGPGTTSSDCCSW